MAMTNTGDRQNIREHMPVLCSNDKQFGTVDRVEGDAIKLTKDDRGQHHWIPMDWVTRVDQHVHVDRPGEQAMREWWSSPPTGQGYANMQGMEGREGSASQA
jgi:hypothetical protein